MMTLKKLSNRKLDVLQDRVSAKYWKAVDTAPNPQDRKALGRINIMLVKIAGERLRRIGL